MSAFKEKLLNIDDKISMRRYFNISLNDKLKKNIYYSAHKNKLQKEIKNKKTKFRA